MVNPTNKFSDNKHFKVLTLLLISCLAIFAVGCTSTSTYNNSNSTIMCTQDYTPVCGTNGQTYSNRCTANAANQAVAYTGECNVPNTPNTKSEMCSMIYAPVCGSDQKTYANSCIARNANVVIIHDGTCRGEAPVTMIVKDGNFTIDSNITAYKEIALTIVNQKNDTVRVDIPNLNVYTTMNAYETVTVAFTPNATGYYQVDVNGAQANTIKVN